jgi:hypothetical protein
LLYAESGKLNPASMLRVGQFDERFQSCNVEMVEVPGGRFWAPYRTESAATEPGAEKPSVPGIDANTFRMRPPPVSAIHDLARWRHWEAGNLFLYYFFRILNALSR